MKSPEVAMLFFEELKFKHDQRVQAEQALNDAVEGLLNYHEKEARQYAKHLKIVINTGVSLLNILQRYKYI